ncbi:MAG: ABC transporter permease [Sphingobacteriaceae bacterium]|jgi:lipopolysaccharide transport system permease protein
MDNIEFEIKPQSKFSLGLKELWDYRELFYFFTWRDVKVKYKQTVLGVLWAVFQPVIMTALFTLGFGNMIATQTQLSIPYPVFALSGFLLWNVFSSGLSNAGNSMVSNANIIKKIYFPRLIIPISSILVSLIDFVMAFIVFIPVMLFYETSMVWQAIYLIPLSILLTILAAFGLGVFLSALNVKYRDFRYILPFFIQALLFATPIIYPITITGSGPFNWLLRLNPMYAPIEFFRSSFNGFNLVTTDVLPSIATSFVLLVFGVFYFRKTESYFADLA